MNVCNLYCCFSEKKRKFRVCLLIGLVGLAGGLRGAATDVESSVAACKLCHPRQKFAYDRRTSAASSAVWEV